MTKMRLLFSSRAIDGIAGGVEKMIAAVMNEMVDRGHEVHFLTWDRRNAQAFYALDPAIHWHRIDVGDPMRKASWKDRLRRAMRARSAVRQLRPNLAVCFQGGQFMALRTYTAGMRIPMIAAERNAPTLFDHTNAGDRVRRLMFNSFRFARTVLVQIDSYRALYPSYLQGRIETIPNPIQPAHLRATPHCANTAGRFRLLSVGRLSYQKNYPSLIEAFAALTPRYPEWDLEIVGEGEDRPALEALIHERGLVDRVRLPGTMEDLNCVYANAQLFCLPSRWEGFPNVLGEAFAHGLPAAGFAGCAGVNELIRPGTNGALADGNGDVASLARALDTLMSAPEERQRMGIAARDTISDFEPKRIMDLWEDTLRAKARP